MSNADFGIVYIVIGMAWFLYALLMSRQPPEGFMFVNIIGWPVPLAGHLWYLLKIDNRYNTVRDYSATPTVPTRLW